jgi:hypothetical protein
MRPREEDDDDDWSSELTGRRREDGGGFESSGADVPPAADGGQEVEGRCLRRARRAEKWRGEEGSDDGRWPFLNYRGGGAREGGEW